MANLEDSQAEFEGFVPTKVKEIRKAASQLHEVRENIDAAKKKFKEDVLKKLQGQEKDAIHDLAVLMKRHKLAACAAGPYKIIMSEEYEITIERGVDGEDQVKNRNLTDPGQN